MQDGRAGELAKGKPVASLPQGADNICPAVPLACEVRRAKKGCPKGAALGKLLCCRRRLFSRGLLAGGGDGFLRQLRFPHRSDGRLRLGPSCRQGDSGRFYHQGELYRNKEQIPSVCTLNRPPQASVKLLAMESPRPLPSVVRF